MVQWRYFMKFNQLGTQLRVRRNINYIRRNIIDIRVHCLQDHRFARPISNMADQNDPITFNSRSKTPYDQFSNFYEAQIAMPEGVFPSVEHYFHAMKFIDKNHRRFEIDGDLGKRRFESGSWKPSVSRGRFIKSAGGKAGTQKYALTLRSNGLHRMWAKQKMKEGLRKKFEAEPFRELLLKTGTRELVHTPMRGKTDFWTGRVDKKDGGIIGENNMGKLLMEVRQELRMKDDDGGIVREKSLGKKDEMRKHGMKRKRVEEKSKESLESEAGIEENTAEIMSQENLEKKGEKRKHLGDAGNQGPVVKRKKVEEKSNKSLESEADVGIEESTTDIVNQGSLEKKRRKHASDQGPDVKRKKVEKKSKDSLESKVDQKKSSDGKSTGGEDIQREKKSTVEVKGDGEIDTTVKDID